MVGFVISQVTKSDGDYISLELPGVIPMMWCIFDTTFRLALTAEYATRNYFLCSNIIKLHLSCNLTIKAIFCHNERECFALK